MYGVIARLPVEWELPSSRLLEINAEQLEEDQERCDNDGSSDDDGWGDDVQDRKAEIHSVAV